MTSADYQRLREEAFTRAVMRAIYRELPPAIILYPWTPALPGLVLITSFSPSAPRAGLTN